MDDASIGTAPADDADAADAPSSTERSTSPSVDGRMVETKCSKFC